MKKNQICLGENCTVTWLCLLVIVLISAVRTAYGDEQLTKNAGINVVWTRVGAVIETPHALKIDVASITEKETADVPVSMLQLTSERSLIQFAWVPNQSYRLKVTSDAGVHIADARAPLKPALYPIQTIELDGLLALIENLRRPAKPTTVALGDSLQNRLLAIATDAGYIGVIELLTGRTVWKTRISEGYVRHVAFGDNGNRLYIGEQAADGFIYAYDINSKKLLWKYRTADDIETSIPSDPGSVYAWIQYPGPSRMFTLPDDGLLVSSMHSWQENGVRMLKSQLYRFDGKTGTVTWKWPADGALPQILRWFDVSADGKTCALLSDESGKGKGRLSVIDLQTGKQRWQSSIEPLKPYFAGVTFWRGVGISPDGSFINVTTDDGRAFIFDVNTPHPIWQHHLAAPLEVSGVPIIATAGTIGATDAAALFVTGDTYIPYHLQKGAQRPAAAHPNGLTLFAYSWTGEKRWQWQLENMPQGLRIDAPGRYAALAVSKRSQGPNESLHGVSVFDLMAEGSGLSKYIDTYRVAGQLPYDTLAISPDGSFIAVVEMPLVMPDETVRGKNRVHILY